MASNQEVAQPQLSTEPLNSTPIPSRFRGLKSMLRVASAMVPAIPLFVAGCSPGGARNPECNLDFPKVCVASGSKSATIDWNKTGVKENVYHTSDLNKPYEIIAGIGAQRIILIMDPTVQSIQKGDVTTDDMRLQVNPSQTHYFRIDDCKGPSDCTQSDVVTIPSRT